jgi:pimeloyl-ACP methyl ester carboxylesterase
MKLFFRFIFVFIFSFLYFCFFTSSTFASTIPYLVTEGLSLNPGTGYGSSQFYKSIQIIGFGPEDRLIVSSNPDGTGNVQVADSLLISNGFNRVTFDTYTPGCRDFIIDPLRPTDISYLRNTLNNTYSVWILDWCQRKKEVGPIYLVLISPEPTLTPTPTLAPTLTPTSAPTATPTPTTIPPSPTPTPKTPLILIPGVGGSELATTHPFVWNEDDGHGGNYFYNYSANEKVWINNLMAGLPGNDDYFDVLRLNQDGKTSLVNLVTTETLFSGYDSAINFFKSNGYTLGEDFFLFPYDWRKDISLTTPLLDQKVDEIKAQTGSQKVDIVAHSMGGLVARNYISDSSRAQNVRKLFTLGTPHLGSVDSLKKLKFGGCITQGFWNDFEEWTKACVGMSPSEVKDVLQNMTSGYELIPSREYYNFYDGQDRNHPFPYKSNGVQFSYNELKSLLTLLNYTTSLFVPSESFHVLDNSLINTNGVDVFNIVGSGISTLGQIVEKKQKDFFGNNVMKKDEFKINGDRTVPLFSASLTNGSKSLLGNAKVFYTKQGHGELIASGSALYLVRNILEENSDLPERVSDHPYPLSGTGLSVYSPVNINVYDSLGNHTGPTDDGDFEENIPGSSYDALDDSKFIFLPDGGNYKIKFEATDKGDFDFKIRKYENDIISQEILYKDIPLTSSTKAETQFDTSFNQFPIIHLDRNGDETIDQDINPSSSLIGDVVYDQIPPQTAIVLDGIKGNNGWYKSDVKITLNSQDDASGSGILKTEYSLDNGQTVNVYSEPFTVSTEIINKLKFRSVDNAGNEEDPIEIEIKIDKAAPEARISVDQNKQDLIVTGVDANSTTVTRLENKLTRRKFDAFYVITDLAGNTLKLDVREVGFSKIDTFRIYSTQYNNGNIKILDRNNFYVIYSGKRERKNIREQYFEQKGETKIRIQYDVRKNKSTIIVRENRKERVKEVRGGLILLDLLTDKGQLKTSY